MSGSVMTLNGAVPAHHHLAPHDRTYHHCVVPAAVGRGDRVHEGDVRRHLDRAPLALLVGEPAAALDDVTDQFGLVAENG